jgi:ribosomal protein S6
VTRSEERAFAMRKREAARRIMKENDPGYYFMVNIFGQETTTKVFDFIF